MLWKVRDLGHCQEGRLISDIQAVLAIEPSNETAKEELMELEGSQQQRTQSGNEKIKVRSLSLSWKCSLLAESKSPTTFSASHPERRGDPHANISDHRGDRR